MEFKTLFSQLVVFFTKLTKMQRIIIASSTAGLIAFLIFLMLYTSSGNKYKNNYKVLFDSLSPADAAGVIEQLEKDQIPYKIPKDNVITIPADLVYKERIAIASLGIPRESDVGFELFDTQEFGATSFDQNVKFLRAIEGELSRTINALAPVATSSVNLAMPKDSLFVSETVHPTASIMVILVENRVLSNKQIRGIKNLVAAAVSRMKVEDVTLINEEGETLGDEDDSSAFNELSSMQQKFKSKQEKRQERKIVEVLSPFIGGSKRVVAKVTIEYDFAQKNTTSEIFDPENVVRSEQSSEEKREGSKPSEIGGVPGTVSNIGPVQGLESSKSSESYEKNNATTNYEISKTVSTTKGEFARIKRISAAVVVDGKYETVKDDEGEDTDEKRYVALDESQLDAITSLVQQSIGINPDRGDLVSVRNFQFESSRAELVPMNGATKANRFVSVYLMPFIPVIKYILAFLLLFILYKKIISPFAERMLEFTKDEDSLEKPILDMDEEEDESLVEKVQQMRKKVEDQLGVGEGFNEDELKYDVILEKLRTAADEKPEEIASLLQALIEESTGSEFETQKGKS